MIKLTGLWKNTGKNGDYFTGNLGNAKVKIFPNTYKKGDKEPDYIMYLDEAKKKEEQPQNESQLPNDDNMESDLPF